MQDVSTQLAALDGMTTANWPTSTGNCTASPGDGEAEFVKLVICSEHAGLYAGPDLYTRPPDEERFVRLYGYCFRVPTGPTVDEVPDVAQYVYTGGSYDDCHDCAYGKKARLCPDQEDFPGYDDAPEIWVRRRDLPEETPGAASATSCGPRPPKRWSRSTRLS